MAECQLPKLDVAGSNPVGRSKCTGVTAQAVTPSAFAVRIQCPPRRPMRSGLRDLEGQFTERKLEGAGAREHRKTIVGFIDSVPVASDRGVFTLRPGPTSSTSGGSTTDRS